MTILLEMPSFLCLKKLLFICPVLIFYSSMTFSSYYMQLKGDDHFTQAYICETYESLIRMFQAQHSRTVLWTRYFKYICSLSPSQPQAETILSLIKTCVHSMTRSNWLSSDLLIPFYHLTPTAVSSPADHTCYANNFIQNGPASKQDLYYPSNTDCSDETPNNRESSNALCKDYYYVNCLVELWFRLYTRNVQEKWQLAKLLMQLMPHNLHVVRLYVGASVKCVGAKTTLQVVYDHLNLHSISNEDIWIL